MTLTLYNTLSRTKETFKPLHEKNVKLYVCGPTVYDLLHVGNFRGPIFFNLVRNWLENLGYNVTYAVNFTDIDDKIIKRANETNKDPLQLSQHYIAEYKKDYARLSLKKHDINPTCTNHIESMVTFINDLIQKDKAYHIEGTVFFSVPKSKDYGKLSNKKIEDLDQFNRIDPDTRKHSNLDFVLWKPAKPGEPSWDSPWGKGRPGWHIECSAMNKDIFGEQIDIHGGGIDLVFPHHENEIAQTEALTEKKFSTFWVHHNFIRFGDEKMSKSLGNVIKTRDFVNDYHPEILKFLILSVHYRSEINMEQKQVHQAIGRLCRIYKTLKEANKIANNYTPSSEFEQAYTNADTKFTAGLNDDFNTPIAFAALFELIRHFNHDLTQKKKKDHTLQGAAYKLVEWITSKGSLLALFQEDPSLFLKHCDNILIKAYNLDTNWIEEQIKNRTTARQAKDFTAADQIRDTLLKKNILIQDTPTGTTWEINKYDYKET
ncbi:cysteine--tRNA ligase [Candidatus Marinamargulisbacteria bacterium SCGC AG-414-C22]|nr:cysteine--tRNA ligase [Candidatus Marinamargulisbacteria bacterium SCGC AG-414-C22]